MGSWRIWPLALGCCLLAACAPHIPAPARLVFASPAPNAVVGAVPETLTLYFSQALVPEASTATVLDPSGNQLDELARVAPDDANTLQVELAQHLGVGRFTVNWQTVSADSGTPASGAFAFTVDAGAPRQPRLAVSPSLTEVEHPVTVTGSGFGPGASITLTVGDDDEPLGSAQADSSGAFTATPALPGDVPFGKQPIWATDPSGTRAAVGVDVRWGGWPPLRVYTQTTPGPDSGEVTFTVVGRNRSDYVLDGVRVSLEIPPAASLIWASDGAQSQPGAVSWDEGVLDRTSLTPRTAIVSAAGPVVGRSLIQFRHRRASGCIGDECLPAFVDETYSTSGSVAPAP